MKIAKKIISLLLAGTMMFSATPVFANDTVQKNYIIDNPYEDINWDEWDDFFFET